MTETYYLNADTLPTIPVPHDCLIEKIAVEDGYIVFTFEKDISYHDSIKHIRPDAASLVIKLHLADEDFELYKWHKSVRLFAPEGYYKRTDSKALFSLASEKSRTEYLYHYVAYRSIIIELCALTTVRLELTADYVEFHWILK